MKRGDRVEDFVRPDQTGTERRFSEILAGGPVVLFFYPAAMTPGCTKEACSFRDLQAEFEEAGAVILGVSTDSLESHDKFAAKYELRFPLLADKDAEVATKYGVWQEKNMYGKKSMGIVRTTFVIDKDGKIAKIWPKVKVEEHADEVLEFVKSLG